MLRLRQLHAIPGCGPTGTGSARRLRRRGSGWYRQAIRPSNKPQAKLGPASEAEAGFKLPGLGGLGPAQASPRLIGFKFRLLGYYPKPPPAQAATMPEAASGGHMQCTCQCRCTLPLPGGLVARLFLQSPGRCVGNLKSSHHREGLAHAGGPLNLSWLRPPPRRRALTLLVR